MAGRSGEDHGRAGGPEPRVHWSRSLLSIAGVALTTRSAAVLLALLAVGLLGFRGTPHLGIPAYLVLAALFVLGLLLVPAGLWLERRALRTALARGEPQPDLPVADLNRPRTRRGLLVFVAATAANVVLFGAATSNGVQVTDSAAFCGSCHRVMDPEPTAHLRSRHAHVQCLECHIGSGASWFVGSTLSGRWQVIAFAFDLYPRPIPVPVESLRPARDTCKQCDGPNTFAGDRLKVLTHFGDDGRTGETQTVLLFHVAAGGAGAHGLHAHVAQGVQLRYRSDQSRQPISEVEWTSPAGKTTSHRSTGKGETASGTWRVLDCIECHNRPTHVVSPSGDEIDASFAAGRIDRALPFLHREGLATLRTPPASHADARAETRSRLVAFYTPRYGELARTNASAIEGAAAEPGRIYAANVWPGMNITWATYPSFAGHQHAPGCFRRHDERHEAAAAGPSRRTARFVTGRWRSTRRIRPP